MIQNFNFRKFLEYANEDINCELINGVLIIHSPASLNHELIFKLILNLLDLYIQKNEIPGLSLGSRFTMRLSSKWAPEPDVMFIDREQEKNLHETYLDGPASVIFEILSPSTRDIDLQKKLPKYLECGVKEVWIIDLEEKSINIFFEGEKHTFLDQDEWISSKYIEGFRIKSRWLWNARNVNILEKLRHI